jgi:hypothetical protein
LLKGNAHMSFEEAVADFPKKKINTKFINNDYTFWHLIEHIRRTQYDILDFITNPDYKELTWPNDYWPEKNQNASLKDWEITIASFLHDRKKLEMITKDSKTDLYQKIPHGTGQTIFREILVVADHNAYHIGELAIMRQVLGAWDKNHK